jgi:hypothetical protein
MGTRQPTNMKERVVRSAEAVLDVAGCVSPIELLKQLQFLESSHVRQWEKGVHECLDDRIQVGPKKLADTFRIFSEWVHENGLISVKATLRTSGRDQSHELRITKDANPEMEAFYRTYYAPSDITPRKLEALKKKVNKPPDLVVFITVRETVPCGECGVDITRGDFLFREKETCLCLQCADLDHLEFLPSGDAAMSRRAKKYSPLWSVVVQFNRRAKRYERRGILVLSFAIARAEKECLSDADQRAAQRKRNELRREQTDEQLVRDIAEVIQAQYPGCPAAEAQQIASHTARRGSGRVGRSAAGRKLHADAVRLAVVAYIRHEHTEYDELLMSGCERSDARRAVAAQIDGSLDNWR